MSRDAVLTIDHLDVVYETEHPVHAVKDVSLTLAPGEILGLAGESGCGKTTLAYAITGLHKPPAKVTSGSITFHDRDGSDVDLLGLDDERLRAVRWSKLSMVFQGAMNALNPVTTIRAQLDDALVEHRRGMPRRERRAIAEGRAPTRRGRPVPHHGVPARTLGRYAAARDDRDGDAARAAGHDHGRADHRARRRRAAGDPPRDRPAARRTRLRGRVHHARPAAAARDQ